MAEFLARTFDEPRLVLGEAEQAELPSRFAKRGIAGGAVYDAFIGMTAAASDAELYTLDRRALAYYERCAVAARLLA